VASVLAGGAGRWRTGPPLTGPATACVRACVRACFRREMGKRWEMHAWRAAGKKLFVAD
jgi:hypothetical protein